MRLEVSIFQGGIGMSRKKKRLSMNKIREILRLAWQCKRSNREIAQSCAISHTAVNEYLAKAKLAEIGPDTFEAMSDAELGQRLLAVGPKSNRAKRPQPDWSHIHQELQKRSVTLQLLWEDYKSSHPEDGYQVSQFCEHYHRWKKHLDVSMRQTHKSGEKLFVDYAGQTLPVVDRETGEIRQAQIFVAVLGASNYTFAHAAFDQSLPNWIGSHIRALEYFGGVPEVIVPDNLKSGVTKTCRYEPELNLTYAEFARHYGCVVLPARVRHPKDKAKVEVGVQVVERWILAALRNRTFFSLAEVNLAIAELLEKLNQHPFKKLKGSRKSLFVDIEKSALRPLPVERYELAEWKKARVNIDYHVELKEHYYSVPYTLVGCEVEVRYTATVVEVLYKHKRIASHRRDDRPRQHTTVSEHMPKSHRDYQQWSPSRMIAWAKKTGDATAAVVKIILERRYHPEQGYRSCLGILRLGKSYSPERLEAACRRAVALGAYSYTSIRSILEKGLDSQPLPDESKQSVIEEHEHIRGKGYYQLSLN
jgi:transposase